MTTLTQTEAQALEQGHLACLRDEYTIIKASGATASDYLQGQITQDIQRLNQRQGIYTAILTPQGKMIADMYIISGHNSELIIITRKTHATALVGRLRQFALGHELRIGILDSLRLISVQGKACEAFLNDNDLPVPAKNRLSTALKEHNEQFVIRMAEAADDGIWIISDTAEALIKRSEHSVNESVIHTARIIKGLPSFAVDWNEKTFPLNANLIEFDGVSFEKGCYVGQEVTSRMNWRGGIKKRFYRVGLESLPEILPCPVSSTVQVGIITSAAIHADGNIFGIAHLPIEIVDNHTPLIDSEGDSVQIIGICHA